MRALSTFPLLLLALVLVMLGKAATAQAGTVGADTLNRLDDMGRKQGWWQLSGPVPDKAGYATGALYEEGRYVNNKRNGSWTRYWPNGKVKSMVEYRTGLPRGQYAIYYENGKLEEQGTWDLDRNTGAFKRWHPNGQVAQEFNFDGNGTRNGEQKYFHENGHLAVDVTMANGREEGRMDRYFPSGDLQETAQFTAGDATPGTFKSYRPKQVADMRKAGEDAKAAPARSAKETTNATDFRAEGRNTLYDDQHRLAQQGDYRKGRLWNGKVYKYNRNGILYKVEVYREGRYLGTAPLTEDDL